MSTELPPNVQKMQDDAKKVKEGFIVPLGSLIGAFYVAVEAFTDFEKPVKPLLALSLACLFLVLYSYLWAEPGYPRYGKGFTNFLALLGIGGFIGVYYLVSNPAIIEVFEVDSEPWKREPAQAEVGLPGHKTSEGVRHFDSDKVLPGAYPDGSSVIYLAIAKKKIATELIIQSLSLEMKDYQPLEKLQWSVVKFETTLVKSFEYAAKLSDEKKAIQVNHNYPTNPQLRDDFTVAIHLKIKGAKPGIYTFTCKLMAKCHAKVQEKETEPIQFVVVDPAEREGMNEKIIERSKKENERQQKQKVKLMPQPMKLPG